MVCTSHFASALILPLSDYQYGCKGRHDTHHIFKLDQADSLTPSKKLGIDIDAVDEPKEATSDIDFVVIGQGAAYEMKSLGSIVLRGNVVSGG